MSIQQFMSGPRSKIKRANRHIDELRQRTAPLDRSLYEITNRKERATVLHLEPNVFQLTYRPKENIPEVFGGIVGDAVGNIRSALDHLAAGIVRTWGAPPPGPLYFPVCPRKDLVAHTGLSAIEQAIPGAKKLILDEIRPDNGPDEHLWDFYTLNKDDKHNFFIPTVVITSIDNVEATFGNIDMRDCSVGGNAASPMVIIRSVSPITIGNNFKTSVEIKFGSGTPFKDDPVIPTLTQISEIVSKALDAFERLIVATKSP